MNHSIQSRRNSLQWTELYSSVCTSYSGRFVTAFLLMLLFVTPLHQVYGAEEEAAVDSESETTQAPEPEEEPSDTSEDSETAEPVQTLESSEGNLDTSQIDTEAATETEVVNSSSTETLETTEESPVDGPSVVEVEQGTSSTAQSDTEVTEVVPGDAASLMTGSSSTVASSGTTSSSSVPAADLASTTESDVADEAPVHTSSTTSTNIVHGATTTESAKESETVSKTEEPSLTTNPNDDSHSDESSDANNEKPVPEVNGVSSTTADEIQEQSSSSDASIEASAPISTATVPYTSDKNRYQFAKDACVEVADGGFYCMRSDTNGSENSVEQVVYATQQANGFSDIFLEVGGDVVRLTDNQYDDTAPYYDPLSQSVVWHRTIDDVYQIVQYELETEEEAVLTNTRTNNMQPVRSGEVTVWQRWVNDAWQVMVQVVGEEPQQITSSINHNIAPYVNGGYVIWNVVAEGVEKQVGVYDITSGAVSYIDDADGGQVTNPRFVLMYDTKFSNGDIVTKGFDPETGQVVPLAAMPAPEPPDIPQSDPVGETRALLNNKTNDEDEELTTEVVKPNSTATTTTASSVTATSTTLDLSTTTVETATSTAVATATPLTDYDLPIAPYGTTTDSGAVSTSSETTTGSSTADTQQSD